MSEKRSYKNVIFAFGSNETTPCSTPEPDFTRQQTPLDCNNSLSPYWWSSKATNNCHQGLLPIDETTEDLYEEVKRIRRQRANPDTTDAAAAAAGSRRQQKRRIDEERPRMTTTTTVNPMISEGRGQVKSLNIELVGCQPQKSSWNCQTLGSVEFTRELPIDVYGKLSCGGGDGRPPQPPPGTDQPPKKRCLGGGGGGGRRGERASASMIIPMIYTHDHPPRSFLSRCSNLPRLTADSIVDLTAHEATLLENDAKI